MLPRFSIRSLIVATIYTVAIPTVGQSAEQLTLYIGTNATGAERGIYVATLDTATGELTPPRRAADIPPSGFLANTSTRSAGASRIPISAMDELQHWPLMGKLAT